MSTISKRGPYQFQALIRRKGHRPQTKTFETRAQAESWARAVEAQIDAGSFQDRSSMTKISLAQALQMYGEKVTVNKCEPQNELARIKMFSRLPIASKSMAELNALDFVNYRDMRLATVSGTTVRLELALLSHLYTIAINEWRWPLTNPLKSISKPRANPARERRLTEEEYKKLFAAVHREEARSTRIWLDAALRLALETGMRSGEILKAKWCDLDLDKRILVLPHTKNKDRRRVALTMGAVELLASLPRQSEHIISGFYDVNGMGDALRKACKVAGIKDFRFHDIRHEVASQRAPHGTHLMLKDSMGWKSDKMASRYFNPTDEERVENVDLMNEGSKARRQMRLAKAQEASQGVNVKAPPQACDDESNQKATISLVTQGIALNSLPVSNYSLKSFCVPGLPSALKQ
ncbi:hypothetical protein B9Z47_05360 [Limnohabitans sp. 2KL-1]|uniref:site-specific integrase n=1 Tax=Limnohabitans sp. 2KL-1 TaxID=1100699 RepID=UPI000D3BF7FE|nr:site-specific integrase [Limnohabitans sp. 2KL-1]PUE48943.1 hypothetical protein B9Z47_05360 [Limnohabitans sp. 2KL-1]